MRYYFYRETKFHGTNSLPIDYYNVDKNHPRYQMIHHWHKEYEFIFVNSGWLELTLDSNVFFLKAGDIALVNPGVMHSALPKDSNYECVVFNLDISVKQNLSCYGEGKAILSQERIIPVFITEKNPSIKKYAHLLRTAMANKSKGFELEALSAISAIFAKVISLNLSDEAEEKSVKIAKRLFPFENAVAYIENNFQKQISLEDLSGVAGMSRKYFSEYFKKVSGRGVMEFLNCYRIERASEMLMHTDMPVTEIALECGFNDLSYFIKTFKKQKNTTPTKYRNDF